jgi:hypothetical protein
MHWDESSRALTPLIVTCAEPGDHGDDSTGRQGGGMEADAPGLAGEEQIPNVGTFATVTSVTTPTGLPAEVLVPEAAKTAGSVPKEHCSVAPLHTRFAI